MTCIGIQARAEPDGQDLAIAEFLRKVCENDNPLAITVDLCQFGNANEVIGILEKLHDRICALKMCAGKCDTGDVLQLVARCENLRALDLRLCHCTGPVTCAGLEALARVQALSKRSLTRCELTLNEEWTNTVAAILVHLDIVDGVLPVPAE